MTRRAFGPMRCLAGAVFALVLVLLAPAAAGADEADRPVVRVGFAEAQGFMMLDEHGNRTGLVVDFLNEIAKYTG